MNNQRTSITVALSVALLALGAGCGGAISSGVAVGKAGHGLAGHAGNVPDGALVCALQEALSAPPAGNDKLPSDTCAKAVRADKLWRKSMIVLGAYGGTLESLAQGGGASAGPMEAALTGVRGNTWIEGDGVDAAARDAAAALVNQMETAAHGGDLSKAIKDAAPHVKTLCDGLGTYLDAQVKALSDVERDVEKKRSTKGDRRCGTVDSKSICVAESVIDRMLYANVYGQSVKLGAGHQEAREAVASFCAAHKKAEEAAADGRLGKDKTLTEVVEAARGVPRADANPAKPGKK